MIHDSVVGHTQLCYLRGVELVKYHPRKLPSSVIWVSDEMRLSPAGLEYSSHETIPCSDLPAMKRYLENLRWQPHFNWKAPDTTTKKFKSLNPEPWPKVCRAHGPIKRKPNLQFSSVKNGFLTNSCTGMWGTKLHQTSSSSNQKKFMKHTGGNFIFNSTIDTCSNQKIESLNP